MSHQNTHKTFVQIVFFTLIVNGFSVSILDCNLELIVDLFAALHERSASSRPLLKLASSVRALLKPYGDTLRCLPHRVSRVRAPIKL